jgi:hypothetical protein
MVNDKVNGMVNAMVNHLERPLGLSISVVLTARNCLLFNSCQICESSTQTEMIVYSTLCLTYSIGEVLRYSLTNTLSIRRLSIYAPLFLWKAFTDMFSLCPYHIGDLSISILPREQLDLFPMMLLYLEFKGIKDSLPYKQKLRVTNILFFERKQL